MSTVDERLQSRFSAVIRGYTEKKHENKQNLKASLDKFVKSCRKHGVNPDLLNEIVKSICRDKLSVLVRLKLSCCLLPRTIVPKHVILKCISWMGTRLAADNVKSVLFSWIVAVFQHVDDQKGIHFLYDIIFHHLGTDHIRRYVCSLLVLMTRKEDVLTYRVQRLLRLKATVGNDPILNNLLAVYKFYCPHLVAIPMPSFSKSLPKIGLKMWTEYINDIHSRDLNSSKAESQALKLPVFFWAAEGDLGIEIRHVKKRRKLESMLPKLENDLGMIEEVNRNKTPDRHRVAVQHVSSYDDLLRCLTQIQLPKQSLTVLRYPLLQQVFSCLQDEENIFRFKLNLCTHLYNEMIFMTKPNDFGQQELFLEKFLEFSNYLQESVPDLKQFLCFYLNYIWNGKDFIHSILQMIPWLRFVSLEEMEFIISPIEKHFILSNLNFKVAVICSFTELAKNTLLSERRKTTGDVRVPLSSIATEKPGVSGEGSQRVYLFDDGCEYLTSLDSMSHIVNFVDRLCTTGLRIENFNAVLLHVTISFYETVVSTSIVQNLFFVCVPPAVVIYASLFSFNVVQYSRICTLICMYRELIKKMKESRKQSQNKSRLMAKQIDQVNGYILDISDSLWRRRTFHSKSDTNSVFNVEEMIFSEETSKVNLQNNAFSLFYHPAFTNLALKFYKSGDSERELDISVFQNRSFAKKFIQFLDTMGFNGILKFVSAFMKDTTEMKRSFERF